MKNDGPVAQQASWCRRWATRAVDALALWGAIKSGAADTAAMSDYVSSCAGAEDPAVPTLTRPRLPKRTAVTKAQRVSRARDKRAFGLAPLVLSVMALTGTGTLPTATPSAAAPDHLAYNSLGSTGDVSAPLATHRLASAPTAVPTSTSSARVPAGLQAAIERTLAARPGTATPRLIVQWRQRGMVRFTSTNNRSTEFSLQPAAFGRSRLEALSPGAFVFGTTRTTEALGHGLSAWYKTSAAGFEQGFTVSRRPAGTGSEISIALAYGGNLHPATSGPDQVELFGPKGPAMTYGALKVVDATGKALPAYLRVMARVVRITVDDAGATYPLTVDPFVNPSYGPIATLALLTGLASDAGLGTSVALSSDGQTALVGDPTAGAAYLYSGGNWTAQPAPLGPVDLPYPGSPVGFGSSVAVDGQTAVVGDPTAGSVDIGMVFIYTDSGGHWGAPTPLEGPSEFGYSVALSANGQTALAAIPSGLAWLYTESGTNWPTTPSSVLGGARSALAVALSGDAQTALVGDPYLGLNYVYEAGASQTISFSAPSSGTVNGSAQLTATGGLSGNDVVFSVDGSSTVGSCSLSDQGGSPNAAGDGTGSATVSYTGAGNCVIDANQAGNNSYHAAPQVQQTIVVSGGPASQAIIFTSTPPATASLGGTYSVSATGGASGNPVVFSVSPSNVCAVSPAVEGAEGGDVTATATVTFTSTLPYSTGLDCVIYANQAGTDGSYSAAPEVQQTVLFSPISETIVTSGNSPDVIAAGPDGNLWFTEYQNGNYIGEMDLTTRTVNEYPVPTADSQPSGITVGPDGNMWFTEVHTDQIGEFNPSGPSNITEYKVAASLGACPTEIAAGSDGNLWFTQFCTGEIDELNLVTKTVTAYPLPSSGNATGPDGITEGPDGNMWFTEWGANQIGEFNPSLLATDGGFNSQDSSFYPLPDTTNAEPEIIAAGPDGNMYFTEQAANQIGEIDPAAPSDPGIAEYRVPTANSDPGAIAQGPDGNMWFTEQDGDKIGEFNPSDLLTGTDNGINEYPVPTANASPYGITAGPDGNIWFAEYNGGKVGELAVPAGTANYTVVADVSGSLAYGSPSPSFTYTDDAADAPGGASVSGSVTKCLTVNGEAESISPLLPIGSYTVDGGSCSGLSLSGSGGLELTLADQGVPDGFVVNPASSYTVTFNANGGTGTMAPETANVPTALTANSFANTGYSFTGWNTAADGSGTAYADGATYPFTANATLYAQWSAAIFTVGYGNEELGYSVALSANGQTALVGAPFADSTTGVNTGVAYIFTETRGTWSATPVASFSDNSGAGELGYSVALSANGQTALVGAPFANSADGLNTGVAYIYTEAAGGWAGNPTPAATLAVKCCGAELGSSVALSANGQTALVGDPSANGAAGAAYIYTQPAGGWAGNLTPAATFAGNGNAAGEEQLGSSVALSADGQTALVGAPSANSADGPNTGVAYIYTEPAGGWAGNLTPAVSFSGSSVIDLFGYSVALSADGQTALVGAPLANSPEGAAYVYATGATATDAYSYAGGGGTGSAPASGSGRDGTTITLAANTFTNPGYSFTGWSDGTVTYLAGATYTLLSDGTPIVLTAQWTANTYTVTFNANGGTGTMAPETANVPTALTANSFANTGYSFTGWNTAADGSGTAYADGATYPFTANAILYAQWTANAPVGQAPAITSANSATFTVGSAGGFTVTTTGSPIPALSESGALPSGVSFSDNGDGTATILGTPTSGTAGGYPITITAGNGLTPNATQSFSLTVQQGQAITFTGPSFALVGSSATLSASGGASGSPVVFSVDPTSTGVCNVTSPGTSPAKLDFTGAGTCIIDVTQAGGLYYTAAPPVTWSITVDQLPAFTTSASYTTAEGTGFSFPVAASGSPVPLIGLAGGTLPGGLFLSGGYGGTATLVGAPSLGAGVYSFTLSASSSAGLTTQAFTLTVTAPPAFTPAASATFTAGQPASFLVTATGTPTPKLNETGTLPGGVTFTDNGNGTATLGGTPSSASDGTFPLAFTATNGVGGPVTEAFTLTVISGALVITSAPSATFIVGTYGGFTVTATGTPAPKLSVPGGLPSGVTFTAPVAGSATLAGVPAVNGDYPITLTASSTAGKTSQAFLLTVDQVPSMPSGETVPETAGAAFDFAVTAKGYPVPALTSGTLPTGVTFTDNGDGTGTLSGTPAVAAGKYTLQVTATNVAGSATETIILAVKAPGPTETVPSFTGASSATLVAGDTFSLSVTTVGSPTAYVTNVTHSGALPKGVKFSNNGNGTATLTGDPGPASGGTYQITFKAANLAGTTTQSFVLTVDAAPIFTSAASSIATVGAPYSFTVRTTGYPAPALQGNDDLPTGLSFTDNGNGTGTFSGTPDAGTGGVYTVFINAYSSTSGAANQTFTLTVRQPPGINSAPPTTATHGVAFSSTFVATGYPTPSWAHKGSVPGLTWSTSAGELTLHGTPTTAGTYPLTVTASNNSGNATQTFTLIVT